MTLRMLIGKSSIAEREVIDSFIDACERVLAQIDEIQDFMYQARAT